MSPDRIDRRLLSILQEEGRISNQELASRIGLSPTATGDRLKRLVQDGYISGFGARLVPEKLDLRMLVFVGVQLDKATPDAFDQFSIAAARCPKVLECYMVAGGFDYLIKVRVKDMAEYRTFLGDTLLSFPGVRETRTYAVMEEVKRDNILPIK